MAVRTPTNLSLPLDLVAEVDRVAGKGNRSAFVADAVRRQLRRELLRESMERTAGAWRDKGPSEWSTPGVIAWVRALRSRSSSFSLDRRRHCSQGAGELTHAVAAARWVWQMP